LGQPLGITSEPDARQLARSCRPETSTGATPSTPLLIFLHVAKTGGSTLRDIVRRQYPPDRIYTADLHKAPSAYLQQLGQILSRDTAVIQGHSRFGLHEFFARRCTYITLLREPVDRVISYYYMVVRASHDPDHGPVCSEGIGLGEYASSGRFPTDNRQTRLVSGHGLSPGPCPGSMLEVAKRNLREHFSVVGLTEAFDETLILLKRTFGWRSVLYSRRNVGLNRPKKASVGEETLKAIKDANRLDIELYDYAGALFREQLSRQAPDFEIEVEALRRVNGQYAGQPSFLRI
jgi:hypothetical protein